MAVNSRFARFMRGASTEVAPADEKCLPELAALLPRGMALYIPHTPHADFGHVIRTALAAQRAGFLATPHIAARRIADARTLARGLDELRSGGIERILLIAGDAARPIGEFADTLDILRSGVLEGSGIARIGVAGHPEGHKEVDTARLWEALRTKQTFAARNRLKMHIVTQFGLKAGAAVAWQRELAGQQIDLPVHVGIAGPTPLAKLIHFAIQCGIATSVRRLMHSLRSGGSESKLAVSPDQHLPTLVAADLPAQIVAPHFFTFGGAVETAHWLRQICARLEAPLFPSDMRMGV